jgi:uncharacterized protein
MTMQQFFAEHPRAAIAFSGGVDSSYLLYAAQQCGADVQAYFVKGAFQPEFELEDAQRLAKDIGAKIKILRADVLADSTVTSNPANRCYYCKKVVFAMIAQAAREDGYTLILDGTNASDDSADRPGMKALEELSVLSPLRICGLTKAEIREKSREAGLFTWDKPSYACLATRVPTGTKITAEILEKTEKAEGYLFSLGFSDFRIRYHDGAAKIQMPRAQLPRVMEHREEILAELKKYYSAVLLDLEVRGE